MPRSLSPARKQLETQPVATIVQDPDTDTDSPELVIPRRRIVKHWAKFWLGKADAVKPGWYTWFSQPGQIEVSVQEYGQPKWIEGLMADLIDAGREILDSEEAGPEYSSVRLQVRLYSHQPDGEDAKFTLEHIEER